MGSSKMFCSDVIAGKWKMNQISMPSESAQRIHLVLFRCVQFIQVVLHFRGEPKCKQSRVCLTKEALSGRVRTAGASP
jgi:hypothetical protein